MIRRGSTVASVAGPFLFAFEQPIEMEVADAFVLIFCQYDRRWPIRTTTKRLFFFQSKEFMPLYDVDVAIQRTSLPDDVAAFLQIANSRVTRFVEKKESSLTGFVPSDSELVFRTLRALIESNLLTGNSFCEWGSGFGTVTCLATILGFDACGIEIEAELVAAARILANDFQFSAKFVHGSFIPSNHRYLCEEAFEDNNGRYAWLKNDAVNAYQELGRGLGSFDVVFAYPWPGEEYLIAELFNGGAAPGAVLLMYSDSLPTCVRCKIAGPADQSRTELASNWM